MENQKTLVSILDELNEIEKTIISSGGELTQDLEKQLDNVQNDLSEKIDNYDFKMAQFKIRALAYRERADKFLNIAKSLEEYSDKLKERIKQTMVDLGKNELVGHDIKFKLTIGVPRLVIDEKELTEDMKMIQYVPDKERIKEALKKDVEVIGARLEQGWQLRTYPNLK